MTDWTDLDKNQQRQALDNFQKVQEMFGTLGYTINSTGWYKDYGLHDGSVVRLVPVFDKGISLDMAYKLVGIQISSIKFIPFEDGRPVQLEQFPRECMEDVAVIASKLASHTRTPVQEVFILTTTCEQCSNEVSSFIQVDGHYSCLECAGLLSSNS